MRVILQRVLRASVGVNAQVIGAIEHGVVLLVGIAHGDAREQADGLAKKIAGLRIFPSIDGASGFDRSLLDVAGGVLCISQFTLYGETKKGRRPDFVQAAKPDVAAPLIEYFVAQLRAQGLPVQTGLFGADMQVELVNDGPVTLVLES
jgi:D-aminoacyl-tRNA deacylase